MFKEEYEALKNYNNTFYISDIIYWLILNKDEKFLPVEAEDFLDFNIFGYDYPIFNLADTFIVCGIIIILVGGIRDECNKRHR